MTVDLGTIKIVPKNSQAVTAQPEGTGFWGNIWDVVKSGASAILNTGSNIILQKTREHPPLAVVTNPVTSYPSFAPKTNSPDIIANPNENPANKFATELYMGTSPILKMFHPAGDVVTGNPAASTATGTPVLIWVGLGLLGLVIVMQGMRK